MSALLLLSLAVLAAAPPDLSAVGVVVSGAPDRSIALLRSSGRTRLGAVGEIVFGGRLALIERHRVVVEFSDGRRELRLAGAPVSDRPLPVIPTLPVPEAPAPGERVMERREVERRLGEEIPRILAETTLFPVTSAGIVTGFTITRIPEGTVLAETGLQAGDILTEINGVAIDSMATLVGLYGRLQGESAVRAIVLRNGQRVPLSLVLK